MLLATFRGKKLATLALDRALLSRRRSSAIYFARFSFSSSSSSIFVTVAIKAEWSDGNMCERRSHKQSYLHGNGVPINVCSAKGNAGDTAKQTPYAVGTTK